MTRWFERGEGRGKEVMYLFTGVAMICEILGSSAEQRTGISL